MDGGLAVTLEGGGDASSTLGADGSVDVLKIVASCWSAARRSSPSFANGAAGAGWRKASMRSMADFMIVLVDKVESCDGLRNKAIPKM